MQKVKKIATKKISNETNKKSGRMSPVDAIIQHKKIHKEKEK